jgi:chorismate dehydratase
LVGRGNLDAALLPTLDALALPEADLLPDLCLAATGRAGLAVLLYRLPFESIQRVAVESGVTVSPLWLELAFGAERTGFLELDLRQSASGRSLAGADAALLTGDAALAQVLEHHSLEPHSLEPHSLEPHSLELHSLELHGLDSQTQTVDLVQAWQESTGHPWVDALWVVRRDVDFPDLSFYFKSSLRYGLSMMDNLVRETAAELGIQPEGLLRRYDEHFSYILRRQELAALEELSRRAVERGWLAPEAASPRFRAA